MQFKTIKPESVLASQIKCYWIINSAKNGRFTTRVFATGEPQIIFHFDAPFSVADDNGKECRQPEFSVCGQVTKFADVTTSTSVNMIGVVFYPQAFRKLVQIPVHELNNLTVDANFISRQIAEAGEILFDMKTTLNRIEYINKFFTSLLIEDEAADMQITADSLKQINKLQGNVSLDSLHERYALHSRKFERLYRDIVGLSPLKYIEITRLNNSISYLNTKLTLTQIAHKFGFYDQSHYTRKFKELTGYTPGEYRKILI